MVEDLFGELLCFRMCQILAEPLRVEAHFVHADKADRGEVVVKRAEVSLGVGIQAVLHEVRDDSPLGIQAPCGDVHQVIQSPVEILLVLCKVCDTGHVDGHNADRTRGFAGAEEAAGFLSEFTQVEAQSAAHRPNVAGLHVRVNVVGEIRCAVLRRHLEQQLIVFCLLPVEIPGDGVSGDRVLEPSSVSVAFDHDLDKRLVHHIHFLLAVAVSEVHFLAANDGVEVLKVLRDRPVQRDVGERCLRAPSAGRVHAVDEGLHALLDFLL